MGINEFEINDKESFIRFLELLKNDYLHNQNEWENKNLEDFLNALINYTEDIQGYYDNMNIDIDSKKASWKVFADLLNGARIYE